MTTETGALKPVLLDVVGLSRDTGERRTLKLHFNCDLTDEHRRSLLAAINAWNTRPSVDPGVVERVRLVARQADKIDAQYPGLMDGKALFLVDDARALLSALEGEGK